jgi:iron complex transport system substrate-binding protein
MPFKHRYILIILFLCGCTPAFHEAGNSLKNKYAQGFTIIREDSYTRIVVNNPWEKARNVSIEYYLINKADEIPENLKNKNIIRVPVERIICLSTSHIAFLDLLGELDKLTGISGSLYVTHPQVIDKYRKGEIFDVGYGQNLNYEEIIRRQPDVVMLYGVDSEITGYLNKFRDLGIPAMVNAEYLEPTPLGKAEWIKFFGVLFGEYDKADSLYNAIESRYNSLSSMMASLKSLPVVMVGFPYRDTWWVPGGESYLAKLISDAGGNYAGKNNDSRESYVISFEEALIWASEAGYWLHPGTASGKSEILAADNRFALFKVFREGKVFNNNKRSTLHGGNDFWESGTVAPDVILADLIRILHPGILPADTLFYYQELK